MIFSSLFKFVTKNTITSVVKSFSSIILLSLFSYIACTNNETTKKRNVNPARIYFDYKIRGQENDDNVSVYLSYRIGGPNGNAIRLGDSANVQLDGERIPVDSAKLAGAFYEVDKPAAGFAGRHTIVFTDFDKKEYSESFIYKPFTLKTKIPAKLTRGDMVLEFIGLAPGDYIRVILADTSFTSRDIHEIDTVENNRLVITAEKLKDVVDGPIVLLLSKETERPIKSGTSAGGRIAISYGMQREFELKAH